VIAAARLLHVDDADEDAAIEAARMGRDAGIHVTSDIERVTERTEELVAAVTIPIFAEHVLEPLTGERDFERALRKVYSRLKPASTTHKASKPVSSTVRLKPDTTHEATYEEGLICVTLGARGAMLLAGETLHVAPGLPLDVIDTTGAGDIFRGAFITSLLRGDAPGDILRFANAAAAISCTRLGAMASVPTTEETDALATKDTKIAKDAKNTDV
jgi:sugar/nucleoside kinase (ribokinase family)